MKQVDSTTPCYDPALSMNIPRCVLPMVTAEVGFMGGCINWFLACNQQLKAVDTMYDEGFPELHQRSRCSVVTMMRNSRCGWRLGHPYRADDGRLSSIFRPRTSILVVEHHHSLPCGTSSVHTLYAVAHPMRVAGF